MEIQTVKIENDGFRVNGNMCVPPNLDNVDYVKVVAWIAEGNTPAPEFTDAEIAANAQAELNVTSRAYLASTDWYITRKAETGDAVPSEITTLRTAARDAIV